MPIKIETLYSFTDEAEKIASARVGAAVGGGAALVSALNHELRSDDPRRKNRALKVLAQTGIGAAAGAGIGHAGRNIRSQTEGFGWHAFHPRPLFNGAKDWAKAKGSSVLQKIKNFGK